MFHRTIGIVAAATVTLTGLSALPAHANGLDPAVEPCVAEKLGEAAVKKLQTQRPNAEEEKVLGECHRELGGGPGQGSGQGPDGPGASGGGPSTMPTPKSTCVSPKGLKRYVTKLTSPNRLGVTLGQYMYQPGAFFYSPSSLARDGYNATRFTMQLYYDGSTGRLKHGMGNGLLSLNLQKWLCSHSDEIREAKRAGLAVALYVELLNWDAVMASRSGGAPDFNHPDRIESRLAKEYLAVIPKIAAFAEKYKVDWFDPANEPDKGFQAEMAAQVTKSAPRRAKAFKGLLINQPQGYAYVEAGIVPDLSGYDEVSLHNGDILRTAADYERTGQIPNNAFENSALVWSWAQKAGVKRYVVGEIGQFDAQDPLPSVAATQAVMDAYLKQFPDPQVLLCQDNPVASMDRFETSPMNPVCKNLQSTWLR